MISRFALLILISSLDSSFALASQMVSQEVKDRLTDRVALDSQTQAIQKLEVLIKKYKGTQQEGGLVMRQAQAIAESSEIQFRISQGVMSPARKQTLDLQVKTLTRFLKDFPNDPERHFGLFLRAKAFEEIEKKTLAEADYTTLISKHPESPYSAPARLAVSDFMMSREDYAAVLPLLAPLIEPTEQPSQFYPHALFKTAWAHFNLNQFAMGIGRLEETIHFFQAKSTRTRAELALLENAFLDWTLFQFEAFDKKDSQYTPKSTHAKMTDLKPGGTLPKMILRYGKLLRAHEHHAHLVEWKKLGLESLAGQAEGIELLALVLDSQFQHNQFVAIQQTAQELAKFSIDYPLLKSSPAFRSAGSKLAEAISTYQKDLLKNKGATEIDQLLGTYNSLNLSLFSILRDFPVDLIQARWNYSETLFGMDRFSDATKSYFWITTQTEKDIKSAVALSGLEIWERVFQSRIQELKGLKLIPSEIQPQALTQADKLNPAHALVLEWSKWMKVLPHTQFPEFRLELVRALYPTQQRSLALEHSHQLAQIALEKTAPEKSLTLSFAGLALEIDTAMKGNLYSQVLDLSEPFSKSNLPHVKKHSFQASIRQARGEAAYFLISQKSAESRLADSTDYLKEYSDHARAPEAALIQAESHLALGQLEKTTVALKSYLERYPTHSSRGDAWNLLGQTHIKLLQLSQAWFAFQERIKLGKLETLSAEQVRLMQVVAWTQHQELPIGAPRSNEFSEKFKSFPFETLQQTQALAKNWTQLDPMVQEVELSRLLGQIPALLEKEISFITASNRVKMDERSIKTLFDSIKHFEKSVALLTEIPSPTLQVIALKSLGDLYHRSTVALSGLPGMDELRGDLIVPLEEKGIEIRTRAFELASSSLVQSSLFAPLWQSFQKENPKQAKKLAIAEAFLPKEQSVNWSKWILLNKFTPAEQQIWNRLFSASGTQASATLSRETAFFVQNPALSAKVREIIRARIYAEMGMDSESITILYGLRDRSDLLNRSKLYQFLLGRALNRYAIKFAAPLLDEDRGTALEDLDSEQDQWTVAYASYWTGIGLDPAGMRKLLQDLSESSTSKDRLEWAKKELDQLNRLMGVSAQR